MTRKKGPNEIFCRSCGDPIKKKAEICPECGVPNEHGNQQQGTSPSQPPNHQNTRRQSGRSRKNSDFQQQVDDGMEAAREIFLSGDSEPHDPTEHSTQVSDKWHYGIGVSIVLWILGFAVPIEPLAGFFFLTAWILMPLSIYFDRQWLRATTEWEPDLILWIFLSVFPLLNVVAGAVYLIRRRNLSEVSSPRWGGNRAGQETDPALVELRERYSRGELSDDEFEEKVEQVIATEDAETARVHMNDTNRSGEAQQENED